jgi:hypothetical protein
MRPFHLHKYKITIWWSAKSGCSTIKHILHRFILQDDHPIHKDTWDLNKDCLHYKNIAIVRDPKTRLVASYLDKYKWWKEQMFDQADYCFLDFVNKISTTSCFEHHFARQFEEAFLGVELDYMHRFHRRFRFDAVYKLEELNWSAFLKQHFNYDLIDSVPILHTTTKNKDYTVANASTIPKPYLFNEKQELPNYNCFFTTDITTKIEMLYKKDYDYLQIYGIIY